MEMLVIVSSGVTVGVSLRKSHQRSNIPIMTAIIDFFWFIFINAVLPLGVPVLVIMALGR
jgi:hypothetical protein